MKLLIDEDELELLKSLEEFAFKEGNNYDSAKGFYAAEERIYLYNCDCIILDINLELTPDGKFAVVSNTSSNDVSIIDVEKWMVIATLPIGKNPKRLWVANTK